MKNLSIKPKLPSKDELRRILKRLDLRSRKWREPQIRLQTRVDRSTHTYLLKLSKEKNKSVGEIINSWVKKRKQ